jgi:hypothetical protein
MSESRIGDIPKFQEQLDQLKQMKTLQAGLNIAGPLLKLFGVNDGPIREALASGKIEEMEREFTEMIALPDLFNDHFCERGWIMYDNLSIQVVKDAIQKAESGDIDGAEQELIDYYTYDTVRIQLMMMNGIKTFRSRMDLAKKALEDYKAGRFYACVLVILALMDGLVTELSEKRLGFFAEDADLTAWNSIAGHSKGLQTLAGIFRKGRRKVSSDTLAIPYRNGIMHGMDLGYDNVMVAAKVWSALFAVADWARLAEKDLLKAPVEPPPEPPKSIQDQLRSFADQASSFAQTIRKNQEERKRLDAWNPRTLTVGVDIPATGPAAMYPEGSPERRLVEFLEYWQAKNYGYMAKYFGHLDKKYYPNNLPSKVREHYKTKILKRFELIDVQDQASAVAICNIRVVYQKDDEEVEQLAAVRLIHEDEKGGVVTRENPTGTWILLTPYI